MEKKKMSDIPTTTTGATGATVKAWRKAHGLTIDAFAAALGLTTGPVKMIEANRRKLSADEARAIARICGQDPAPLLALLDAPPQTRAPAGTPIVLRLVDLVVDPDDNDRPAREGARPWAEALTMFGPEHVVTPYDLDDLTPEMVDGEARYLADPIVRPEGVRYRVLGGHRRSWRALLAGALTMRCRSVDCDDEQAAVLAIADNTRQEIGPVSEARALDRVRRAHRERVGELPTAAWVATRVGRSEAHVTRRLALLDAIPDVLDALVARRCTIDVAEFFARRPHADQLRAWPRAVEHGDGSGGDVVRLDGWIRRLFASLPLARAPWPLTAWATLRPGSDEGAEPMLPMCATCPSNTGRQLSILGEQDADAECMDAACYGRKAEAWADHLVEQARAQGIAVLEDGAARAAVPLSPSDASGGFVDLDAPSPIKGADTKPLTWRIVLGPELLAKLAPEERAVADLHDQARELVKIGTVVEKVRAKLLADVQACTSPDMAEPIAAQGEALDAWARLAASQRSEVRPAPPAQPEAPRPAKPGTADERKKSTAKPAEHIDATLRTLAASPPLPSRTVDAWALRAVSSDAVCYVAEALDLDGAPAEAVRGAIDAGTPRLLVMLLAAELLHRGGETADMVKRAIGAPSKAPKKSSKKKTVEPEDDDPLHALPDVPAEDDGTPFSELPAASPVVKRARKGVAQPEARALRGGARGASGELSRRTRLDADAG